MSQNTVVIADGTGAQVLGYVNNALNTLVTTNSGSSAPATTYAYMLWADTANNQLKMRNSTNTAWIIIQSAGPVFSATRSTTQSISSSTFTKVQFNTEVFDTNSNYDNSSTYRFTPTVSGYYQFNWRVSCDTTGITMFSAIYKNGSIYRRGAQPTSTYGSNGSAVIYMNGSTDYVEIYAYGTGSFGLEAAADSNFFDGSLMRAA